MLRKALLLVVILLLSGLPELYGSRHAAAQESAVYVIPLDGPVEKGLFRFMERSFKEAERTGAEAIILELNTPGGFLDAAFRINDLIAASPVPVYAYVRWRALSAGAYLALACHGLYMAPGSTMGAAEPRSLVGGEEVDEKTLSAWESEMRAVAERQGKDPEIAAAMVRREIAVEGVVEAGKLLTLTAVEAQKIGFIDGIAATRAELLKLLGLEGARIVVAATSPAEEAARLITHPAVATLLVTIGIAALVIEVMTAGFGVAGAISILAFALFFGGHIVAGLAGREVIFLFLLGVVLLLVEAFIPNFGIIGLSGLAAVVASVVLSAATTGEGLRIMLISVFLAVLVIAASLRFLKRTGLWSQIILQFAETKEQGYVGPGDASHLVGKTGVALTPLRPAGVAEIEGKRVDVVSEGGFIARGTEVLVVAAGGSRVVVRPV